MGTAEHQQAPHLAGPELLLLLLLLLQMVQLLPSCSSREGCCG
jgi:hypothetical protein